MHLKEFRLPFKDAFGRHGYESSDIEEDKEYIEQMSNPMGQKLNDLEGKMTNKMDPIAGQVARSLGFSEEQFPQFLFRAMVFECIVYLTLSILSAFQRPDFLNLTIGTIAVL